MFTKQELELGILLGVKYREACSWLTNIWYDKILREWINDNEHIYCEPHLKTNTIKIWYMNADENVLNCITGLSIKRKIRVENAFNKLIDRIETDIAR